MRSADNLLLVEGESDRSFFEAVCADLGLHAAVRVAPPRDVGGRSNTKQGVINHLPLLAHQLADGSLKRLAAVVDADYVSTSGLGFAGTSQQIEIKLQTSGFTLARRAPRDHGLAFTHPDGLADIGVWIMPNNRDEGSLEDFLHRCVAANEQPLFTHAQTVVNELPAPKFAATQRGKAELATWLAWQSHPGRGPQHALRDGLFATTTPPFKDLQDWLRRIFS